MQPADASVVTASPATFSVTATVPVGQALSYQWYRNGAMLTGSTGTSYTVAAPSWRDDGSTYAVIVSSGGKSTTSRSATLKLALSADQQVFESVALQANGGVYALDWSLNYVGGQVVGVDYLGSEYVVLTSSPLTAGPQDVQQQPLVNITHSLTLPAYAATRYLVSGNIVAVPNWNGFTIVTYVGDKIQVDSLATDGSVGYSELRSGFAVHALSGMLSSAPAEMQEGFNSVFGNPLTLDQTTNWQTGSTYLVYTAVANGDRYAVFDCQATTSGTSPSPCQSGTTLVAAMNAGEISTSDQTTYVASQGAFTTVGGVPVWVATAPRPQVATQAYTTEYRIYFQLNGNVYTGVLIHDGAITSSTRYRTVPSDALTERFLPYKVRLNQASDASISAAVKY
ncbi:MAG TPA: hypothetical protein VF457_01245 [Burkholderiaceae bacterium]